MQRLSKLIAPQHLYSIIIDVTDGTGHRGILGSDKGPSSCTFLYFKGKVKVGFIG